MINNIIFLIYNYNDILLLTTLVVKFKSLLMEIIKNIKKYE